MDLNAQKKFYDNYWKEVKAISTYKRIRITSIIQRLGELTKSKDKTFEILDAGCGDCRSLGVWALFGTPSGLELSKAAVDRAREVFPLYRIEEGDITRTPFNSEEFDVVICQEVIEHLEDQKSLLLELLRVLKKRGYLILTTPNKYYFDRRKGGNYSHQPIENLIGPDELKRLLTNSGFRIKEFTSLVPGDGDFGIYRLFDNILIKKIYPLRWLFSLLKDKLKLSVHLMIVATKPD